MIKVITAYTFELDDPAKAARSILDQVNPEKSLLKNSAALLFCHAKFFEMGVLEAVCKSLPFEVAGCTSQFFAIPGASGDIMLAVMVLTSDDIEFTAGISQPLAKENMDNSISALYKDMNSSSPSDPSLIFAFPPTMPGLTGDLFMSSLDRACGGLPVFGTLALDMDTRIRNPGVFLNGTAYKDRMALLFLKGPVRPEFYYYPFPEDLSFAQDAVITGAKDNLIISINNRPAVSFLSELGLAPGGKSSMVLAMPLIIKNAEETETQVAVVQSTGANGELVCDVQVQAGGVLNIGSITANFVLESLNALVQELKRNAGGTVNFIFSCFLRSVALGGNDMAEIELLEKEFAGFPIPYLFLASGGELCPVFTDSGKTVNRSHQYTLIACQI